MKKLLLLLLLAAPASAQTVTPNFTQGSMQSTTTTTDITRTINQDVYGGNHSSWSGSNVTPSADIAGTGTTFSVDDTTLPWSLEVTTREAGIVEDIDITETIQQTSTTTSLSIFSQ